MSCRFPRAPFAPAQECDCAYHRFISSSAAEHDVRQSQSSGRSSFRLGVYGASSRARFARRFWKGRSLPRGCANSQAQVSIWRGLPGRRDADKQDTQPVGDRARRCHASGHQLRSRRSEWFCGNEAYLERLRVESVKLRGSHAPFRS